MQSLRCSYTFTAVSSQQGQRQGHARRRFWRRFLFSEPGVILCNSPAPRQGQRKGQVVRPFMACRSLILVSGGVWSPNCSKVNGCVLIIFMVIRLMISFMTSLWSFLSPDISDVILVVQGFSFGRHVLSGLDILGEFLSENINFREYLNWDLQFFHYNFRYSSVSLG